MDLGFTLFSIDQQPHTITEQFALVSGAAMPVMVPLEWLDHQQRARWSIARTSLPLHHRVRLALLANLESEAWEIIAQERVASALDAQLALILATWSAQQQARLKLPAGGEVRVLARDDELCQRLQREANRAYAAIKPFFEHFPAPRWGGPLLLVEQGYEMPRQELRWRPALPTFALPEPVTLDAGIEAQRAVTAAALGRGLLASLSPPVQGWPAWLERGVVGVCIARANGDGPSPLKMQRVRRNVGIPGLRAAFAAANPDSEASTAIAAILLVSRRREHFPSLLDLLRNGIAAEKAIQIAYGLSLNDLLIKR